MTEPSTDPNAPPVDAEAPVCPSTDLLNLIVAFLTPMFLGASAGDVRMARLAAIEMVCAYRAYSYVDLLTIVQLVAFSLTTLDSLSLSMGEDLSLSMILRLRGNANALHRSSERHRCTLQASQQDLAERQHDAAAPREVPPHAPIPASAFQASEAPAETQVSPPKTPQASNPSAPPPAMTPQRLRPLTTPVFPEPAALQMDTPACHLTPSRQVNMRAALSSSASYLVSGAELPSPYSYNADARTT